MSLPTPLASLAHVARIITSGPAFAVLCACYHSSSALHEASPTARVEEQRQRSNDGRRPPSFPGAAVVTTPNGGFAIRIISGLIGGAPLYIIDGAPMLLDPSRGIDWFKPEDIVRISVLKDPSQTSVYGPRGVNGVIVISTKQGAPRRQAP